MRWDWDWDVSYVAQDTTHRLGDHPSVSRPVRCAQAETEGGILAPVCACTEIQCGGRRCSAATGGRAHGRYGAGARGQPALIRGGGHVCGMREPVGRGVGGGEDLALWGTARELGGGGDGTGCGVGARGGGRGAYVARGSSSSLCGKDAGGPRGMRGGPGA